jgi:hypothetical protein
MAANVYAEPTWLNTDQMKALFQDGITFSYEGPKATMNWDFLDDGTWSVETGLGGSAWGNWKIKGNRVCLEQTGNGDGWQGFKNKSFCPGIWGDSSELFYGRSKYPLMFADPSVLARLQDEPNRPERGQANDQKELAKQKHELELQRLALAREQLAEETKLAKLRIELERQKLDQEKRALSQQRLQKPSPGKTVVPDIEFGTYHAVVIGINDYKTLPKLNTALIDARAIAQTLNDEYGYKVHLLENPNRGVIIDKFDELREILDEDDNLLIYYAGHGWLDEQSGRGYWLPVDAREDRRSRWLSNADLTDALQALFAKHVMIVADSCYSGTLTRSIKVPDRSPRYLRRIAEKRTRVVLSSGGLEPVSDSGGGKHSVFAAQFLKALRSNEAVLDGTQLFEQVRQSVVLKADQTPEYSDIRRAGHEGGDFLFVRRN